MRADFDRLRVVLVATRNSLNIGAAARAMSNFGFLHLRVVSPYEPSYREARSAVGAAPLLANAQQFDSVADAVADCTLVVGTTAASRRELHQPIRRLEQGARLIKQRLRSGGVALLFGSEKRGLSNEDLSHCHWLMQIPTREEHRSMNLGQAVAVCLYELARDAKIIAPKQKEEFATAGDAERIGTLLIEVLRKADYMKPPTTVSTAEKMRRTIRRLGLSPGDVRLALGMLRQILWKLESQSPATVNRKERD
ncbi:MAG TPA: TrmJ/YjtD family RNA methyltransferase [Candidatus Acidoferrales bacterium]|nr:TrmJ/YjtD family RNA methyltransferase [Candidatus Acidoferrales bacterium]